MPRALKDRPLDCLESLIRKSESKMNVITEGVKLQVCSAVGLWLLMAPALLLLGPTVLRQRGNYYNFDDVANENTTCTYLLYF